MIVNYSTDKIQNHGFYIIGIIKSIIIFEQSLLSTFFSYFEEQNKSIYIFSNAMSIFNQIIKSKCKQFEIDSIFLEEITNFNDKFSVHQISGLPINNIDYFISSSITGYLIKNSYIKLDKSLDVNFISYTNSLFKEIENGKEVKPIENFEEDKDFITIRRINQGSLSNVELIYEIEKEELFLIKKPNNPENDRLIRREFNNYLQIDFPLIPKLYGRIKGTDYPVIQFINGKSLKNIQQFHFSKEEKIIIIFEILLTFEHFHDNLLFVYRDLKPDNVIISQDKDAFIIDFDRMVKMSDMNSYDEHTADFQTVYVAPEVNLGEIDFKNDIYSIGQMIYYIMNEKKPCSDNNSMNDEKLFSIYKRCTDNDRNNRPHVIGILLELYILFPSIISNSKVNYSIVIRLFKALINMEFNLMANNFNSWLELYLYAANQNYSFAQFIVGKIYYEGIFNKKDIKKAIHYLTLAAEQDNINAELYLGEIYFNEKNFEKSLYYYSFAANKNNIQAQYIVGVIYSDIKYLMNINKAIHYFTLAANQNHCYAQFNLGLIYYNKSNITKDDFEKALHYFTLASNQNEPRSHYFLGEMYSKGQYIKRDINKSIHHYTFSANANIVDAQLSLGLLYFEGWHETQNIEKAIHYLTLAADQNDRKAQFILGKIYYEEKYHSQDYTKANKYLVCSALNKYSPAQCYYASILYHSEVAQQSIKVIIRLFEYASNDNDSTAQFYLGIIYYENKYIKRDIDKSIHYILLEILKKQFFILKKLQIKIVHYHNII